jgi:polyhydroxyalkanoate synthase
MWRVEKDLAVEFARIARGRSSIEPPRGDFRFTHPVWAKNPYYRRVMQAYIAWRTSLYKLLQASDALEDDKERAEFFLMQLTEALAPTNRLTGNPGFLDTAVKTRGKSLLRGVRNFASDVLHNGGMPKQVDDRPFKLGKTLATSDGFVVYRSPMFELIQYVPKTETVYPEPVLLAPPQINKYYIVDLAPDKSFVRFCVERGLQFFVMSWRNPTTSEQGQWGFDSYVDAVREALDVVREISESRSVHVMGACAAGITSTALMGYLWEKGEQHKVASLTLLVTILDTKVRTLWGLFAVPPAMRAAAAHSRRKGIVSGHTLARAFSWLRPSDLVWGFVANNYLMGKMPPAFDFLYWNSDSTRVAGNFHADLIELFNTNSLKQNEMRTLDTDIDASKVDCDSFVVDGIRDHIVPWRACYSTTQILGGDMEFILASSGHIQSVVSMPGKRKSRYFSNKNYVKNPDEWLESAETHKGSWWPRWVEWAGERSGTKKAAPRWLGNDKYRPGDRAPGRYVHQH